MKLCSKKGRHKASVLSLGCLAAVFAANTIAMALEPWPYPSLLLPDSPDTSVTADRQDPPNRPPLLFSHTYYTLEEVAIYPTVSVYDKEADEITLQILEAPTHGRLSLQEGALHYAPYPDCVGTDTFVLQAVDSVGNCSDPCTMEVVIEPSAAHADYPDLKGHFSHYSALKLQQAGILVGEQVGGVSFFAPEQSVSRGQFLVYLLSVCCPDATPAPCVNTGLTNDASLSPWLKPYLSLAMEQGLVREESFAPDENISRAEAVVMVHRAAGMENVAGYHMTMEDVEDIPDWAMQSYLNLSAYRMLDTQSQKAAPDAPLTKAVCSDLLWQLYQYRHTLPTIE